MNRSKLKVYAPKARRDFIRAMMDRAAYYGITEKKIEPVTEKGDVAIIAGKAHPIAVANKRRLLQQRITQQGFDQVMEAMAYTWFNRLVAIRFMEIHGYLDHGYRVLSHPEGKPMPGIVEHAEHVDLPGLDKRRVIELKLDGTKEVELYRMLLIAQCNALHSAMPFLFEKIDDETELLLPDNLLHSDSLVRQMVNEIDEDDWQEVEIIGWIYQFYISEKKDQVIGKVVASDDIPAATQLFTPNWIAKYLVQNSLGRQWMATYPNSPLKALMEYYIEPAGQTPEVQAQLKVITPTELNPEELTLMDPACGSGHILVEGYDIFMAIYQERGYRMKDIPRLILEKNLFGLEIDDRAAQLAAFALMMKARADDRRIFDSEAKLNIVALQQSPGARAEDLARDLNDPIRTRISPKTSGTIANEDIIGLVDLFSDAKTFGSLLRLPPYLARRLPAITDRIATLLNSGDLVGNATARLLDPLARQANILVRTFDAVATNPPYMGRRGMNLSLKSFAEKEYPNTQADLFSMFIEQGLRLTRLHGHTAMVTMQSWMFLSSFAELRSELLSTKTLQSMAHLGARAFEEISGEVVQTTMFDSLNHYIKHFRPVFFRLVDGDGQEKADSLRHQKFAYSHIEQDDFARVPSAPIAYAAPKRVFEICEKAALLKSIAEPRKGMVTADNPRFVRNWQEVDLDKIGFCLCSREEALRSKRKWFPLHKGGEYRKWYGNTEHLVNWENDGRELLNMKAEGYKVGSTNHNLDYIFKPALVWTKITSGSPSFRMSPSGFIFHDASSLCPVLNPRLTYSVLGLLNSYVTPYFLAFFNATLNINPGNLANVPYLDVDVATITALVEEAVNLAREDWNSLEVSWDFEQLFLLRAGVKGATIASSWQQFASHCSSKSQRMKQLEEENNRHFIGVYGLQSELSPEVTDDQITLYRPNREEDIKRLISYSIGCMIGRYSLDKPGLIYAHSGNRGFDPSQYKTFHADDDGIIPLTETSWFNDDATNRIIEFVGVAWQREHRDENVAFIADSLNPNKGEQPRDTICRYLAQDFYKEHLKTYKKRPIYWLFSSGKQRAFQCLVYLHRYHEGTLSRMRTEYVIPLQGKISARIEQLAGDIAAATSSAYRTKLTKERDKLLKQQKELELFDDKLRHYADLRISLDLDDGVKVNYGKFGDLLAEVKAITGGADE